MLIDINKIIVNDRIRKDYGDLEELAEDIRENTLLNALVVSPNGNGTYTLIAGERRLRAMRDILGYTQVIVNTVGARDDEHALLMEISENECRKEFTKTERLDYARRLARIESAKAKERMLAGKTQDPTENSPQGETREIVAETLGTSSNTIAREQFIEDHRDLLDPADFAEWDEGKLSTNKAFQRIKAAQKRAEQERDEANEALEDAYRMNEAMEDELESLRSQPTPEPEVIEREVIPEETKRAIRELEKSNRQYSEDYESLRQRFESTRAELQEVRRELDADNSVRDAMHEVKMLTNATNEYVGRYGKQRWNLEDVDEQTISSLYDALCDARDFISDVIHLIGEVDQ